MERLEIHLSDQICTLIPNFKIGIIQYEGIEIGPSPQMIKGRYQLLQQALYFDLENRNLSELSGIKEWRTIFKKIGRDPNRYRHSAESLYRRVKKRQFLDSINSAIDLNNFFSLQFEIPLGIYDLQHIKGNITIRMGQGEESYFGLNGRENPVKHLLVTADELGPFGSPFVDSKRSAVSEDTKNAIQFIYLRPSTSWEEGEKVVENIMNTFLQYHGGSGNCFLKGCRT